MSISSIIYKDLNEWSQVRDNLYETIFNGLIKCIDNNDEYNQMVIEGITDNQRIFLMDLMEEEFYKISLNKKWAEYTTFNLLYGIQGFIQGFIKNNKWRIIFNALDKVELIFEPEIYLSIYSKMNALLVKIWK
jgi:hypothetical protein